MLLTNILTVGCLAKTRLWVSFPFFFVLFCAIRNSLFQRPWSLTFEDSSPHSLGLSHTCCQAAVCTARRLLPQASATHFLRAASPAAWFIICICPPHPTLPGLPRSPCTFLIRHSWRLVSSIFSLLTELTSMQAPWGQERGLSCHLWKVWGDWMKEFLPNPGSAACRSKANSSRGTCQ